MCVGSSVSYVLLMSFPFPLLEDILVHMWINYVSHAPFAIKKQYQHFPAATETPIHRKSYRLASFSREKGGEGKEK